MTYEYQCRDALCAHQWETEQRITDPAESSCPKCQKETAQRLCSASAFILNGAGWFKSGGY